MDGRWWRIKCKKKGKIINKLPLTQVLQDCGFKSKLKVSFVYLSECLIESFGFFSAQPRKAWER